MIVIFECNSLLARALALVLKNAGESVILPSAEMHSMRSAMGFLIAHAGGISSILVSSYASFMKPPKITDCEGLDVLGELLMLEELDDIPKVLYSYDPIERLSAQGKEIPFHNHKDLFEFVRLPGSLAEWNARHPRVYPKGR